MENLTHKVNSDGKSFKEKTIEEFEQMNASKRREEDREEIKRQRLL